MFVCCQSRLFVVFFLFPLNQIQNIYTWLRCKSQSVVYLCQNIIYSWVVVVFLLFFTYEKGRKIQMKYYVWYQWHNLCKLRYLHGTIFFSFTLSHAPNNKYFNYASFSHKKQEIVWNISWNGNSQQDNIGSIIINILRCLRQYTKAFSSLLLKHLFHISYS